MVPLGAGQQALNLTALRAGGANPDPSSNADQLAVTDLGDSGNPGEKRILATLIERIIMRG